MVYQLENATVEDLPLLIKYKLNNMLDYANEVDEDEIAQMKQYANSQVSTQIENYKIIKLNHTIMGCLLVQEYLDGVMLEEIYIEEEYRNKGIGTKIIRDVLKNYPIVYLWVYKSNAIATRLYEKLGFNKIESTKTRYFMKYSKGLKQELK